jgi:hypothetical protein
VKADKGKLIRKHREGTSANSASEKLSLYLDQLAQQKKAADLNERKKLEQKKRRQQLLSERIRAEANERRLMNVEDDNIRFKVGVVGLNSNQQQSKKVTAEAVESMIARLANKQASNDPNATALSVPARDYADWKRKNSVPSDTQVFSMTGPSLP